MVLWEECTKALLDCNASALRHITYIFTGEIIWLSTSLLLHPNSVHLGVLVLFLKSLPASYHWGVLLLNLTAGVSLLSLQVMLGKHFRHIAEGGSKRLSSSLVPLGYLRIALMKPYPALFNPLAGFSFTIYSGMCQRGALVLQLSTFWRCLHIAQNRLEPGLSVSLSAAHR